MIVSYRDKDAERLSRGMRIPRYRAFERQVLRKLRQLEIAGNLNDLRIPPGNHLEALSGDREGQYSIRINGQFRICFSWTPMGPQDVEIVDYH
jgi:proteic killer suppression protein